MYEDELQLVIPDTHPLKDFKKVSIRQAAEDEFSFDDEAMGEEAPADAEEAPVQE